MSQSIFLPVVRPKFDAERTTFIIDPELMVGRHATYPGFWLIPKYNSGAAINKANMPAWITDSTPWPILKNVRGLELCHSTAQSARQRHARRGKLIEDLSYESVALYPSCISSAISGTFFSFSTFFLPWSISRALLAGLQLNLRSGALACSGDHSWDCNDLLPGGEFLQCQQSGTEESASNTTVGGLANPENVHPKKRMSMQKKEKKEEDPGRACPSSLPHAHGSESESGGQFDAHGEQTRRRDTLLAHSGVRTTTSAPHGGNKDRRAGLALRLARGPPSQAARAGMSKPSSEIPADDTCKRGGAGRERGGKGDARRARAAGQADASYIQTRAQFRDGYTAQKREHGGLLLCLRRPSSELMQASSSAQLLQSSSTGVHGLMQASSSAELLQCSVHANHPRLLCLSRSSQGTARIWKVGADVFRGLISPLGRLRAIQFGKLGFVVLQGDGTDALSFGLHLTNSVFQMILLH
ncbi:hypothetical protein FB451DRAFT_1176683 [Mycena latifolia]|nr:hypothetical protein FB451DRAFT_1176683 [Mycena latifolia]